MPQSHKIAGAQVEPFEVAGGRPVSAHMVPPPVLTCAGCGKLFVPRRSDQRHCAPVCRVKAQRARQKRNIGSEARSPTDNPIRLQAPASAAVTGHRTSRARSELVPCIRAGYPSGLVEGTDADGLPIFFDDIGPLVRCWGSGRLSDLQLANMRLEATGHNFPGGKFYRQVGGNRG